MRKRLGKLLLPILAACSLAFATLHVVNGQQSPPRLPPPLEPARTPFDQTVAGAGIVEAVSENMSVGTAIAGLVLDVYGPKKPGLQVWSALVGERVKAGDPLFRVDDRALQAQLACREARLQS